MEELTIHTLPGITRVAYLPCLALPSHVMYAARAQVPVAVYQKGKPLTLTGSAEAEMTDEPDNNGHLQKAQLTFYTSDRLPQSLPLAFIVTTVQGDSYLIGAKDRPFPAVKVTQTTGTPEGSSAVLKVVVSFTAAKAMIPCII